MSGGPIPVRCEGSGASGHEHHPRLVTHGTVASEWMCPMCGGMFLVSPIPEHDRDDILARIDRGDFG